MEDICKSVLTRHRGVRHEPGGCSACSRLSRGNDDEILHSRWICFLNPDNRRVGLRIVDFLCERHVSFAGGVFGDAWAYGERARTAEREPGSTFHFTCEITWKVCVAVG